MYVPSGPSGTPNLRVMTIVTRYALSFARCPVDKGDGSSRLDHQIITRNLMIVISTKLEIELFSRQDVTRNGAWLQTGM